MKILTRTFLLTLIVFQAVSISASSAPHAEYPESLKQEISPLESAEIQETTPKMRWGERVAIKLVQKRIERLKRKGKLEKKLAKKGKTEGEYKLDLWAMILGLSSLVLIFIPYVSILGILGALGGIILGAISIKKVEKKGKALTGIIAGSATILLLILALVVVASLFAGL